MGNFALNFSSTYSSNFQIKSFFKTRAFSSTPDHSSLAYPPTCHRPHPASQHSLLWGETLILVSSCWRASPQSRPSPWLSLHLHVFSSIPASRQQEASMERVETHCRNKGRSASLAARWGMMNVLRQHPPRSRCSAQLSHRAAGPRPSPGTPPDQPRGRKQRKKGRGTCQEPTGHGQVGEG